LVYLQVMKKILLLVCIVFLSIPVCFETNAEPAVKRVRFESKTHDFGDILISDGKLECTFTFENMSDKPVVVHTVISSCGCTTPHWTKEPVQPGGKGTIHAVYTNDQEGSFDKTLTVYISDVSRPVILRLRGYAHATLQNIKESYSTKAGVIGLKSNTFSLGYIDQYSFKEDFTQIINTSGKEAIVEAVEVSEGLRISFPDNHIPAAGTAKLYFRVDLSKLRPEKWGRQNFTFKLSVNGKTQNQVIQIKSLIKEGFEGMAQSEFATAPKIEAERSYFEFGNIKKGEVRESSFTIINGGKKELIIHAADVQSSATSILSKFPIKVAPGRETQIRVKYDSAKCKNPGEVVDVLSVITNAPDKPVLNLYVTGTVLQ